MDKSTKKAIKWSKSKIIAIVLASVLFLTGTLTLILLLQKKPKNLNLVGNYMDMTGVNASTLFVAEKTKASSTGMVYADEELVVYNDTSTDYSEATNVQFVLQGDEGYSLIKYYKNNERIEDANDYVNEISIPEGWYISTYSITEKFIFVKFQYNFDGVKFEPSKFLNVFGVYNSPLEFHTKTSGNNGHEVVAIDRDTGLVSSVVDVMEKKGYLIETPNTTTNQAGDMFVIEYNYTELVDTTATYTVGMYRGEVYIISSDEDGALQIDRVITLSEIKEKITLQLAEYIENNPTLVPNFITHTVNKYLNSEKNQIEYAGDGLNFYVDKNGSVLIYFSDVAPTFEPDNSYTVSSRIYGAAYSIDSDLVATYIVPLGDEDAVNGYMIIDSEIVNEVI